MLLADVVREVRRLLGDVPAILGASAPTYNDDTLIEYIKGAALQTAATSVFTDLYVIEDEATDEAEFDAEPSTIEGLILAAIAYAELLNGDLIGQVLDGNLGISFTSGMEQISTTEAAKKLSSGVDSAKYRARYLITLKLSATGDFVMRVS